MSREPVRFWDKCINPPAELPKAAKSILAGSSSFTAYYSPRSVPMLFIGADPGANGGIAVLDEEKVLRFRSLPEDYYQLSCLVGASIELRRVTYSNDGGAQGVVAVLEKVSGYIGKPQPGSRMFKFGEQYGRLKMAFIAAGFREGVSLFEVTPQEWQGGMGIPVKRKGKKGDKKETDSQFKNRLKKRAEQLFPDLLVTLATADALLMAYYCRMTYGEKRS